MSREQIAENTFEAKIRLLGDVKLNDFLTGIIPNCEVQSLHPIVPSMNDIFIQVVQNAKEQDLTNESTTSVGESTKGGHNE